MKRVTRALVDLGLGTSPVELTQGTRTAAEAAAAIGCDLDQIAKSIIFAAGDDVVLFLTAGGNMVNAEKASALAGTILERADAALIRARTGFAIGGVSPVGLIHEIAIFADPRLMDFAKVWPAAGTPRHVFEVSPGLLIEKIGAQVADFI